MVLMLSALREKYDYSWQKWEAWLSFLVFSYIEKNHFCKDSAGKLFNKYKDEKSVIKIERSVQGIWWLKLNHSLNLGWLVVYHLFKPINNDKNSVVDFAFSIYKN